MCSWYAWPCICSEARVAHQMAWFSSTNVHLIPLRQGLSVNLQPGWWLEDPVAFLSLLPTVLELQVHADTSVVAQGRWGPNSGPQAYAASTVTNWAISPGLHFQHVICINSPGQVSWLCPSALPSKTLGNVDLVTFLQKIPLLAIFLKEMTSMLKRYLKFTFIAVLFTILQLWSH